MSCQGTVSPKGARKLHDADVVYLYCLLYTSAKQNMDG